MIINIINTEGFFDGNEYRPLVIGLWKPDLRSIDTPSCQKVRELAAKVGTSFEELWLQLIKEPHGTCGNLQWGQP